MSKFEEYDINNDHESLMAYIPSIDNVPIVGKKIEQDKNRIIIYSPEQMRKETQRHLNRGIFQHMHLLRDRVFLTDSSGRPFFEGYIAGMEHHNLSDMGGWGSNAVLRSEIRLQLIGTT